LEELIKKETDKDDIMALAHDILKKTHPDAVFVIHHLITAVQSRWEEVMAWANQVFLLSLEIALLLHLFFFFLNYYHYYCSVSNV